MKSFIESLKEFYNKESDFSIIGKIILTPILILSLILTIILPVLFIGLSKIILLKKEKE